ncbi:MAG TPA: alpha/beta hydrolase [Propionibacteriaceae bacterium]|nr:alpha/beta hydrolase [Propionibacteriaceae bacterium]
MSYSKVRAEDGTMLRAWSNDATGIPVVISNGLGASPTAWPALAAPDCGFRVVTWHHRGLGGSDRPARPGAIRVEDFASDLSAVMVSAGMERALVVGWSFGVNAAFEFARGHPGRIAGLLAIAGVPGGSLAAMYGPMRVPKPLREPAGQMSAQLLPVTGPWLTMFAAAMPRRFPAQSSDADRVAQKAANDPALRAMLREFAAHDWEWYSRLAVALGEHPAMNVADTSFPVTFLGGRHDAIAGSAEIQAVASTIRGAQVRILPSASHLLPLQYPDLVVQELRKLARRSNFS